MHVDNVAVAISDLELALARYRRLWFWQRWFNTYECQCATHMVRLANKAVKGIANQTSHNEYYNKVEPMMHDAHVILGEDY